jgi:hypothetical protein
MEPEQLLQAASETMSIERVFGTPIEQEGTVVP